MSKTEKTAEASPKTGAVLAEIAKTVAGAARDNFRSGAEALQKSAGARGTSEIIDIQRNLVHEISKRNLDSALAIHDLFGKAAASFIHG